MIDQALITGRSLRDIAGRFGTSKTSVARHRESCVPASLAAATKARDVSQANTLLERLARAHRETWEILAEVRRDGEPEIALKALARIEKQLELEGRIIGELQEKPSVTIFASDDWQRVRAVVLDALSAYPATKAALVSKLAELSA
ncbi:MAG: hypothetical protein HY650_16680 [Acidobacteria bacterium]|nr:hypothetical protein [Acidobacteriota bacterium]